MLPGSLSHPWLLPLLLSLFAPLLAAILWCLLVYAIGKYFRGANHRRLKLAIALTTVAASLPVAGIALQWSPDFGLIPLHILLSFGGVGVMLAAFTFGFVYVLPQSRAAPLGSAERERVNGLSELCMAAVLAGWVLAAVGNFANTMRHPALFHTGTGMLLLASMAMQVWCCGICVGRASMRWRRRIGDGNFVR